MAEIASAKDALPENPVTYGIEVVPKDEITREHAEFAFYVTSCPKDRTMFIPLPSLKNIRDLSDEKIQQLTEFCRKAEATGVNIGDASYTAPEYKITYMHHFPYGGAGDILVSESFYPFGSFKREPGNALDHFAGTGMADLIQGKIAVALMRKFGNSDVSVIHPDPQLNRETQLLRLGVQKDTMYYVREYHDLIQQSLVRQQRKKPI